MEHEQPSFFLNYQRVGGLWLGWLLCFSVAAWCQTMESLPPQRTIVVHGHKTAYHEAGKGNVVILVHGLGADSRHWAGNFGPLSERFHVIALDQIGYGQSDKPIMRYTIEHFSEYLHGFLGALAIPRVSLVGSSLGGWVVLDFAIRYPQMVEKLVLVDAAGLRPDTALKIPPGGMKRLTIPNVHWFFDLIEANKDWATMDLGPKAFERHVQNGDSYTIASSVAEMATGKEFEDQQLGKVRAPTLVVWGSNDALMPLPFAEKFHRGIAGSELAILEGGGHIPMVGKAAEFNQAVLKFLSSPELRKELARCGQLARPPGGHGRVQREQGTAVAPRPRATEL